MAIQVIERGTPPSERIYEATCNHCRSRMRFQRADAQYRADQRDGDYLLIKCPVCSSDVTHSV